MELSDEQISRIWDAHTVPVFGKTGINPIVFARAIESEVRQEMQAEIARLKATIDTLRTPRIGEGEKVVEIYHVADGIPYRYAARFTAEQARHGPSGMAADTAMRLDRDLNRAIAAARAAQGGTKA